MQSQEVISINIWQILISLLNLVILFLILKKALFKPVKNMLAQRQAVLEEQYASAAAAEAQAMAQKAEWEQTLQTAAAKADAVMQNATAQASRRGEQIVAEAKTKAEGILRQAEADVELERKKADAGIRHEIVDVSVALTAAMLGREVNTQDHRALIDSFIEEISDGGTE